MVSDMVRRAEVNRVLSAGYDLGEGDTGLQVRSNGDDKMTVYSMIDGEPREILRIHADRVLTKMLPDGRPAFWAEGMSGSPPAYKRGTVKCYLHPEFDEKDGAAGFDRAWVDAVGLSGRTCNMSDVTKPNKADFRSVFDRDAHMRRAHRDELRIITDARARLREEQDREERRKDREAMLMMAQSNMRQPEQAEVAISDAEHCDECSYMGTQANVRRHKTMKHTAVTPE